jgi:hypothetical protein
MKTPFVLCSTLVDVLHACPPFCTCLGLQSLACLALCSRSLKKACQAAVVREAPQLLDPITVAATHGQLREHHQQAAVWLAGLLQRTAEPTTATTAADVAEQLICLPSVDLSWAVQLVEAGVRISHSQLLHAASSMLAGVEVWVQAQQQLGVQTDILAVAVAICCDDEWVSGSWAVSVRLRFELLGLFAERIQPWASSVWLPDSIENSRHSSHALQDSFHAAHIRHRAPRRCARCALTAMIA